MKGLSERFSGLAVLIIFFIGMPVFAQQQYSVSVSVIGNGGIAMGSSEYSITGTAGQPAVGASSGSSFNQITGFWQSQYLITDVNEEPVTNLPIEFKLEQNYPNPFNPSTVINFQLPVASNVSLIVYDILGRKVAELINSKWKEAGFYKYELSTADYHLSSGIYIYRLLADSFIDVKKFVVLK